MCLWGALLRAGDTALQHSVSNLYYMPLASFIDFRPNCDYFAEEERSISYRGKSLLMAPTSIRLFEERGIRSCMTERNWRMRMIRRRLWESSLLEICKFHKYM